MRNRGFTLLEVLLALGVFTIIGIATVKQISQIATTKRIAFEDIDLYNEVRAGLNVLRSDLGQAFHVLYADLGAETQQAVIRNEAVPHTLFDGRKSELIFTSLSHRIYFAGRKECEQTEISYFLQKKDRSNHFSLVKRESERIDADLYKGGVVSTLLDDVASIEFRYWDDKQLKWMDDWNSDAGNYRDKFPQAVKVKLKVARETKTLDIETQIKIAFPNNEANLVQF